MWLSCQQGCWEYFRRRTCEKFSGSHLPGCLKLQWKILVPCGQMEGGAEHILHSLPCHVTQETGDTTSMDEAIFYPADFKRVFPHSLLQKKPLIYHFRRKSRITLPFEEIFVSTCRFKSQQGKLDNENIHQQSPSPFKFFILKILNFKNRFSLNNARKDWWMFLLQKYRRNLCKCTQAHKSRDKTITQNVIQGGWDLNIKIIDMFLYQHCNSQQVNLKSPFLHLLCSGFYLWLNSWDIYCRYGI